ncbi:5134_t:CDS:2, partial [Dentiscutata heterogama]
YSSDIVKNSKEASNIELFFSTLLNNKGIKSKFGPLALDSNFSSRYIKVEDVISDIDNIDNHISNFDEIIDVDNVVQENEIKGDIKKERDKRSMHGNKKVIDTDEDIQSDEIKGAAKKERGKRSMHDSKKGSGYASRSL